MVNLITVGILEILGIIRRNKVYIYILFMIFLWLLLWNSLSGPDRNNYMFHYRMITGLNKEVHFEIGMQIIMLFCKKIGFSFQTFLAVYSGIAYILITKTVLKYSENPALVASFYFLFPFLLDSEQLRSLMGMAIMVYGITFLIEGSKKGYIKYGISCLVATLFHASCFVYFLFFFVFLDEKTIKKIVIMVIFFILLLLGNGRTIFTKIFPFLPINKVLAYFYSENSNSKMIYSVLFFLLAFLLFNYTIDQILKNKESNIVLVRYYKCIRKINLFCLSYLPLVAINDNFMRLPRSVFILNYIIISNYLGIRIKKKKQLLILLFAIALLGVRLFVYFIGAGFESFIIPYFYEGFLGKQR